MLTVRRGATVVALTLLMAGAAACGDSDDGEGTTPTSGGSAAQVVEVTAVDYGYEDVPSSVAAGTQLSLTNASAKEIHEVVALLLPEDEDRSAEEIAGLPEAELGALFQGEPATVLIAPPDGAEMIPALGDGTLSEPGRYLLFCGIPVGADPQEYLDAAATGEGGPPDIEGGAPHFTQGMYGELTVE